MPLYLNDSGTWRQILSVYVNDNGTWREIQQIYANDAGTWRTVFFAETITLTDSNAQAITFGAQTATAVYRLANDGNTFMTNGTNNVDDVGDWITPQNNMGNYECRVDLTSGSLTSGTTGAWQSLSTTRSWTLVRPAASGDGTTTATGTVQIRRAADALVMATATITWIATISS